MPRTCTVCTHPDRPAIDMMLVNGKGYRDIAGRFGVSKSALERHRAEHLPAAMVQAKEAEDVGHAIDVVKQLKAINSASLSVLSDARKASDGDLALKAIDRVHRQIELQAKLIGQLDERPQINVLVSPEWLTTRSTIVRALAPYEEARQAVAAALMALERPA